MPMPSTTKTKKEIVDFLWEWAEEKGHWAKLLTEKVVSSERSLSSVEREGIFDYFLQQIGLTSELSPTPVTKPVYVPTDKKIRLTSLSEVSGVNKLAEKQTLAFSPNLTVIFGDNGSGKTGYGRILKAFSQSYDKDNVVLSDISAPQKSKSAVILFETDGNPDKFVWDGTNRNDELQNVSVFNSQCVQISIGDHQLIVSPIGFHLFNLISDELKELSKMLDKKMTALESNLGWKEALHEGTTQNEFVNGLSYASSETELLAISSFGDKEKESLSKAERELSKLNKNLVETEIQILISWDQEIAGLIEKIETAQNVLSDESWQRICEINKAISGFKGESALSIKEVAEKRGVQLYESNEFSNFLKAAESYIKALGSTNYPSKDDLCIYCLQLLNQPASELIASYRNILDSTAQEELNKLLAEKAVAVENISRIDLDLSVRNPKFGVDKDGKSLQPTELIDFKSKFAKSQYNFALADSNKSPSVEMDYPSILKFLNDKKTAAGTELKNKRGLLANISTNEETLKKRICELKDRSLLLSKQAELKEAINAQKNFKKLRDNENDFRTNAISIKTSQARAELLEGNFDKIFADELKAFRKSHIQIDLGFSTESGASRIRQKLGSYLLSDILSEGEQKAIALAEFLSELQLDNTNAPVIFDDPVNSLDHRIIDEVAKRLVQLSKSRQVIVFTHSILLLNSFIQERDIQKDLKSGIDLCFHEVKENFGTTGFVYDCEEVNSHTHYVSKMNEIITSKHDGEDESKVAADGYSLLRSAIELTVEQSVLKDTVKRYRKGVAFPSLLRIDGALLDQNKEKLNSIYEKCCSSIDAHSNPASVYNPPKIEEFKSDYEDYKVVRRLFK